MKDNILRTLTSYSIISILASPIYGIVLYWFYFLAMNLGEGEDYKLFFVTGTIIGLYIYFGVFPVILNLMWSAYKAKTTKRINYLVWLTIVALISVFTSFGWITVISVLCIFMANKWMHKLGYRVQFVLIALPFLVLIAFTLYMIYKY